MEKLKFLVKQKYKPCEIYRRSFNFFFFFSNSEFKISFEIFVELKNLYKTLLFFERLQSMGLIDLFKNYSHSIWPYTKKTLRNKTKKVKIKV